MNSFEPIPADWKSGVSPPLAAESRAFSVLRPSGAGARSPLVFNSPHSGCDYPADFIAGSPLDLATLRRSEDSFIDEIFADAPRYGAPLLKALFPRAYLDVNREAFELDPGMFADSLPGHVNTASLRAAGGLGTIARVVADGKNIYREKLPYAEAERRVATLYRPYHAALNGLLEAAEQATGAAVLIDCHSMPSQGAPLHGAARRPVEIILGDRFGASCAPLISQLVEKTLSDLGYLVTRNNPYAGGHITGIYGDPERGRHALQIEINRALYMDEALIAPNAGFTRLRGHMSALIATLGATLTPLALASL